MNADACSMLARMRPLPARLRIAHLAALLRVDRAAKARELSSLSLPLAGRDKKALARPHAISTRSAGEGSDTPDGRLG